MPNDTDQNRLPPHSVECERGVLGCCLLDPEAVDRAVDVLASAEAFYDLRNREVFTALRDMRRGLQPIDVVTLGQRLRDAGKLDNVGGYAALSALMDSVPSAANLDYYLEVVREKFVVRTMLSAASRIASEAFDCPQRVGEWVDRCEAAILDVNTSSARSASKAITMKALARLVVDDAERAQAGTPTGVVATGFPRLDALVSMEPGAMIVIAARPSVGKSAFAGQVARQVATAGLPVAIFSLEMTGKAIAKRTVAGIACRHFGRQMTHEDYHAFASAVAAAGRLPIHIDDTPGLSVASIRARLRRLKREHGIKLAVVDYLQLVSGDGRYQSREAEVSDVSRQIKATAKELGMPIIVLAQLNRDVEKGSKPRVPRMSDLRESGAIEQDADVIALLHPEEGDAPEDLECPLIRLIVDKQREGATGNIRFRFYRSTTRYGEIQQHNPHAA